MPTPAVSICIPTFNSERFLARGLESCINQTFSDIEVIVSDDCSTDATARIATAYAARDSRIRVLRNRSNLGLAKNWACSFAESRGVFIQHLGHDDWLSPDYVERKLLAFRANPGSAFISGPITTWVETGNHTIREICRTEFPAGPLSRSRIFRDFYRTGGLVGLFCMARRGDFLSCFSEDIPNPFGWDFFRKGVLIDNAVFLRIAKRYEFATYCPGAIYNGLSHDSNASKKYAIAGGRTALVEEIRWASITTYGTVRILEELGMQEEASRFRIYKLENLAVDLLKAAFRTDSLAGFITELGKYKSQCAIAWTEIFIAVLMTPFLLSKRIWGCFSRAIASNRQYSQRIVHT